MDIGRGRKLGWMDEQLGGSERLRGLKKDGSPGTQREEAKEHIGSQTWHYVLTDWIRQAKIWQNQESREGW